MANKKKTKADWKESKDVDSYSDDSYVYYTKEVHEKVCEFIHNDELSQFQRNKIYEKHIYPAFDEMVRIMINTYNFYYTGTDPESLVQEVNVKMYDVLETSRKEENKYYDESYGSSYSYFSRVAKNYMIQKQSKHQDNKNKYGMDSINEDESYYIETFFTEHDDVDLREFINYMNIWLKNNIDKIFDKEEDKKVAYGILDILENEDIEMNNPKLFFYMMKEQYGNDDYRINKVKNILREHYTDLKNQYLDNYYLDTNEINLENE